MPDTNPQPETNADIANKATESMDFMTSFINSGSEWIQANYPNLIMAIATYIIGMWLAKWIASAAKKVMTRSKTDPILVNFLSGIILTTVKIFVIIAALTHLGFETTSLIAILGAAGLAVGLALKDSLQNFASGVMLIIFRPFKIGDFVEAGGISGVVEKIEVFATTMRTGDNKEIIIPNSSVYGGTITNFSAKETRRVDMVFGIGYEDDIKKAKEVIQQVLDTDERILKDPATVIAVSELADSSVNFVVRPWVKSGDYWGVFFDTHENIKLAFDQAGISIPYPQMDVHNPSSN